jgi:hypothetical protein
MTSKRFISTKYILKYYTKFSKKPKQIFTYIVCLYQIGSYDFQPYLVVITPFGAGEVQPSGSLSL